MQAVNQWPKLREHFEEAGLGGDPGKWPTHGCGARFAPHKRGPSKVVEFDIEDDDGTKARVSFLAERLPVELEDVIKKVHKAFHEAQQRLTAADIKKAIPLVYPKTNAVDPTNLPGVSRWDFAQWEADGRPYLDTAGWCALCRMIANKDLRYLRFLYARAMTVQASL